MLAESFLTAVATGGSAGGSGSSADDTAVAVNLVRRVVVVVVSRETESAGDLTVRAGRGPPGTELISASSPSHPSSTTLNLVTSSVTTTVRGTTTIDSTTGATPVAAPQMPAFTPPAGSVLITPRGGTVRLGAATLTFAPGALSADTWILIRTKPATGTDVLATSAVYELLAFDAATGAVVTHFAASPRFAVQVGDLAGASTVYYLDPETGAEKVASTATDGVVSAELQHFSEYVVGLTGDDLIALIAAALTGTLPTTAQSIGDKLVGNLLKLSGLQVTYSEFTSETSSAGTLWTGTVSITATGGALGDGATPLATLGTVTATYTLNRALATAGVLSLTATSLALNVGSIARGTATGLEVEYDAATDTFRLGGTGVSLTIGPSSGPSVSLTNGTVGMLVKRVSSVPKVALLVTGDVSMTAGGVTLNQPAWRFGVNELTGLASTPVVVQTGTGSLTLDLADGELSLSGDGTLALPSSLGTLTGHYVVTVSTSALAITVSNGAAHLTLGGATLDLGGFGGRLTLDSSGIGFDASATGYDGARGTGSLHSPVGDLDGIFTFSTRSGGGLTVAASSVSARLAAGSVAVAISNGSTTTPLTITSAGVAGTVGGTVAVLGVPGLEAGGTLALSIDTTASTPVFRLSGTDAHLSLAGLLGLNGTLTVTRTDTAVTVALSGTATGSVTVNADGTFTASGTAPLSLPVSVPGLTLGGTATFAVTNSTFTVSVANPVLVTPVGSITGPSMTVTKSGGVLSLSATGMTLFLGDAGSASITTDDVGIELDSLALDARLLPTGALVLHASGNLSVVGTTGLTFTGPVVADYNPTDAPFTFGTGLTAATVAARTTRISGLVSLAIDGGVALQGTITVEKQVTSSGTTISVSASGVNGTVGPTSGIHVEITDGSLGLLVDSAGVHLSAAGAVDLVGTTSVPLPTGFDLGGTLSVTRTGTTTTVLGTGLRLTAGPVTVRGTVGLTVNSSSQLVVTVSAGSVDVQGLATATGIGGTATFGATPSVLFTATAVTINLGPATLKGALRVDDTSGVEITVAPRWRSPARRSAAPSRSTTASGATRVFASNITLKYCSAATSATTPATATTRWPSISSGSLDLTVSAAGVVGTLGATVAISVGGLSIPSLAVSVFVDTTGISSAGATLGDGAQHQPDKPPRRDRHQLLRLLRDRAPGQRGRGRTEQRDGHPAEQRFRRRRPDWRQRRSGGLRRRVAGYLSGQVKVGCALGAHGQRPSQHDRRRRRPHHRGRRHPMRIVFGSDEGTTFSVTLSGVGGSRPGLHRGHHHLERQQLRRHRTHRVLRRRPAHPRQR